MSRGDSRWGAVVRTLVLICLISDLISGQIELRDDDQEDSAADISAAYLRARLKQMAEKSQKLDPLENQSKLYEALLRKVDGPSHTATSNNNNNNNNNNRELTSSSSLSSLSSLSNEQSISNSVDLAKKIDDLIAKFRYHNMGNF